MRRNLLNDRVVLARDRKERHTNASKGVVRARIRVVRSGGREGPGRCRAAEVGDDESVDIY